MLWLVRSAIALLYPRTNEWPGAEDCGLDEFLERFRRESTPLMWLGVVVGALVFHLTPILTVFVPLPAFFLTPALADRHAHKVSSSGIYLIRQAVFLVKLPGGLVWGSHPLVRERFALPALTGDPGTFRGSEP
jgi:hypothetical protein